MKKTFLFILVITTNFCIAQTPIIPMSNNGNNELKLTDSGAYVKDDNNKMNPWVGTWLYTNGNDTFQIIFTKHTQILIPQSFSGYKFTFYADILNGGYYYKENGIVKTDHLIYTDQFWDSPIMNVSTYSEMNNRLTLRYKEFEKNPNLKSGFVHLTLLPGSTTQAKWEFDPAYRKNYSVPDNVILTKQ